MMGGLADQPGSRDEGRAETSSVVTKYSLGACCPTSSAWSSAWFVSSPGGPLLRGRHQSRLGFREEHLECALAQHLPGWNRFAGLSPRAFPARPKERVVLAPW